MTGGLGTRPKHPPIPRVHLPSTFSRPGLNRMWRRPPNGLASHPPRGSCAREVWAEGSAQGPGEVEGRPLALHPGPPSEPHLLTWKVGQRAGMSSCSVRTDSQHPLPPTLARARPQALRAGPCVGRCHRPCASGRAGSMVGAEDILVGSRNERRREVVRVSCTAFET